MHRTHIEQVLGKRHWFYRLRCEHCPLVASGYSYKRIEATALEHGALE